MKANTTGRITLSGRNGGYNPRTVFFHDVEIGHVEPSTHGLWSARDLEGRNHGDTWLSDWAGAMGIVNALGLRK